MGGGGGGRGEEGGAGGAEGGKAGRGGEGEGGGGDREDERGVRGRGAGYLVLSVKISTAGCILNRKANSDAVGPVSLKRSFWTGDQIGLLTQSKKSFFGSNFFE